MEQVLILIILEYIYIRHEKVESFKKELVLILIILEYIYIGKSFVALCVTSSVLILIILEYIYIHLEGYDPWPTISLNPYYTGIHLHILIIRLL